MRNPSTATMAKKANVTKRILPNQGRIHFQNVSLKSFQRSLMISIRTFFTRRA